MLGHFPRQYVELCTRVRCRFCSAPCFLFLVSTRARIRLALAIFLDNLLPGISGFFISTSLIVVFGEIVPQALCTRYPLPVGAHTVWLVKIVMILISPIAWPISVVLDWMLGQEVGTLYNNEELKELISRHIEENNAELGVEQGHIMQGALDFPKMVVKNVMTSWDDVFHLPISGRLDFETLTTIWKSGHSRIPCMENDGSVSGILFVKDLVLIDPEDETPLSTIVDLYSRNISLVMVDDLLSNVLKEFREGRSHLAIVRDIDNSGDGDPKYVNVGIVSLEDIVEAILKFDIVDETDRNPTNDPRTFDETKLSLFDYRRRLPPTVTPQEAQAILLHLSGSVDVFKPSSNLISARALKTLILESIVLEVVVKDEEDEKRKDADITQGGYCLYKLNESSDNYTLILDGKVEISAGREGFKSELARWTSLCEDALRRNPESEKAFKPDFTARVVKSARILRISRQRFWELAKSKRNGADSPSIENRKHAARHRSKSRSHAGDRRMSVDSNKSTDEIQAERALIAGVGRAFGAHLEPPDTLEEEERGNGEDDSPSVRPRNADDDGLTIELTGMGLNSTNPEGGESANASDRGSSS